MADDPQKPPEGTSRRRPASPTTGTRRHALTQPAARAPRAVTGSTKPPAPAARNPPRRPRPKPRPKRMRPRRPRRSVRPIRRRPPAPRRPRSSRRSQAAIPGHRAAGQLLGRATGRSSCRWRGCSTSRATCATRRRGVRHVFGRDGDRLAAPSRAVRPRLLPVFHAASPPRSREGEGGRARAGAVGDRASGRRPTGWSARCTTCSA